MASSPLASASVTRHVVRGGLGLLAFVAAVVGAALGIPAALVLLAPAALAWRGCPTCWAIGLAQTRSRTGRAAADNAPGRKVSAELLGQSDDDALGAAHEAEPVDVLVLRDLADEL